MHHRGTDLDTAAAKQDEFGDVAPRSDTTDAGERQRRCGVGLNLLHHVERDGFYSRTTVAAVRTLSADIRIGQEGIEVDASDGVDGVDGRESICSSAFRGARSDADVGDVGREFDDDGCAGFFFDPGGDLLAILGDLADCRTHSAFTHSVRTTEVEFEAICTCVFCLPHNIVPAFTFALNH